MAPLGKEKKEIMYDLLESVKTENLDKQFEKVLPPVLDGETPKSEEDIVELRVLVNTLVIRQLL